MALTKVIGQGIGSLGSGAAADTKIVFDGNAQDYYIGLDDSADSLVLGYGSTVGSTQILRATTAEISFNDDSADVDFRVESNGATHMLFVQAGSDCLGIKTTSPNDYYADDLVLTVPDEGGMTIVQGTSEQSYLAFADGNSGDARYRGYLSYDHGIDSLYLGTSANVGLKIDSTGAVTKPLQPAFSARPTNDQSNIATSSDITVIFDQEIFDQNADFNTSNYTFTAPVTGRYQLQFSLYIQNVDSAATYYYGYIVTSNRNYVNVFDPDFGQDAAYWNMNMGHLVDMDANDTAYIRIRQQAGTQQTDVTNGSRFTGYLVA